jgi:hypothetical protein
MELACSFMDLSYLCGHRGDRSAKVPKAEGTDGIGGKRYEMISPRRVIRRKALLHTDVTELVDGALLAQDTALVSIDEKCHRRPWHTPAA